jgi:hypothetical protein
MSTVWIKIFKDKILNPKSGLREYSPPQLLITGPSLHEARPCTFQISCMECSVSPSLTWVTSSLLTRAGHALFLGLRACAFALLAEPFRALFWALNFALLRSRFRAPSFSRSYFRAPRFSRSYFRAPRFSRSYFRAPRFSRSYFRARIFALVLSRY